MSLIISTRGITVASQKKEVRGISCGFFLFVRHSPTLSKKKKKKGDLEMMTSSSKSSPEASGNFFFPTSSDTTNMADLNIPLPLVEIEDDDGDDQISRVSPCSFVTPFPSYRTRQKISALDQAFEKEIQKIGSASDPKKLRRTISNRLSAQRSRNKKAQNLADLEQQIGDLEKTIAILNPRIENYKNKRRALLIQKATLEQRLHDCMIMSNLCNIEIEKNKQEVQRLKEVEKKQREQMMLAHVQSFGMQYHHHHHHHHPQQLLSSPGFRHQFEESNNTDPAAAIDQYINFDALN